MVMVKICGIHDKTEAKKSMEYGADFLGLLVDIPGTNLSVSSDEARKIVSGQKDGKFIILTIEKDPEKLLDLINKISPWGVQLLRPTKDSVSFLSRNSDVKIIPVVHITDKKSVDKAREFFEEADYILLDSRVGHHLGGTGKTHNWNISKKIIEESKVPVFLAGGLSELNVKEAINITGAHYVDAESLLRNESGFRDLEKVKKFIQQAKN